MIDLNNLWIWIAASGILLPGLALGEGAVEPVVFATFANDSASIHNVLLMAESIRTFGGMFKDALIRAYVPAELEEQTTDVTTAFETLRVEMKTSRAPEASLWFFYAPKVFAAAQAEAEAGGLASVMVFLDSDTIVLQEPAELILPEGTVLGYRPVMHKNVGLLYTEPLDTFWARALDLLSVSETSLFPMVTPADDDTIRPYFNAGCLAVRPERGLMAEWAECFTKLYTDSAMAEMCKADRMKRIFIHQVALTGAILRHLERSEMSDLSDRYNYGHYFSNPAPDWDKRLKGPEDRIAWMKERL
jgi:hypothetical protein